MDLEDIRKHYEKMSDNRFIKLLTTNAHGLRPEVYEIIKKEIKKRKLSPDLFEAVLAQNKEYSLEEIEVYAELIRKLPCPICKRKELKLNGTICYTVTSFILFSSSRKEVIIACPDCLNKENKKGIISTALFGWWAIPWVFLKTPLYIYRNFKAKKENDLRNSNNTLKDFTLEHIGEIETYKQDKKMLSYIIENYEL